jgi:hypothetical protein
VKPGAFTVKLARIVERGTFHERPYARISCAGIPSGAIELAAFGAAATPAIGKPVTATHDLEEGWVPFQGPNQDHSGRMCVPADGTPDRYGPGSAEHLVPGVVGKIAGGA